MKTYLRIFWEVASSQVFARVFNNDCDDSQSDDSLKDDSQIENSVLKVIPTFGWKGVYCCDI